MMYKVLVRLDKNNDLYENLRSIKEPVARLNRDFTRYFTTFPTIRLTPKGSFIIGDHSVIAVTDEGYIPLVIKIENNLYVTNKWLFKSNDFYKVIYDNFHKIVDDNTQVTFCKDPGYYKFMQFVPPKFNSIAERKEFGEILLNNFYNIIQT